MNAIPLLRAKSSVYEGRTVYTADGVTPVAWQCTTCGITFGVLTGPPSVAEVAEAPRVADACCTPPVPEAAP